MEKNPYSLLLLGMHEKLLIIAGGILCKIYVKQGKLSNYTIFL